MASTQNWKKATMYIAQIFEISFTSYFIFSVQLYATDFIFQYQSNVYLKKSKIIRKLS
jgi:hypothetical protein